MPLIIGFNWVFVILGSIAISRLLTNNIFLSPVISALIAFIFDLILEPIAIKLDYWSWSEGIIPIQNYLAWFVIALISALGFNYLKVKVNFKNIFTLSFCSICVFCNTINFLSMRFLWE